MYSHILKKSRCLWNSSGISVLSSSEKELISDIANLGLNLTQWQDKAHTHGSHTKFLLQQLSINNTNSNSIAWVLYMHVSQSTKREFLPIHHTYTLLSMKCSSHLFYSSNSLKEISKLYILKIKQWIKNQVEPDQFPTRQQ